MYLGMHTGGRDRVSRRRELLPVPESAGAARVFVRSTCGDWGVDGELCDDAQLIATELVANVVDHAGTRCEMTVRVQGEGLCIEVRDFYPCAPPRPRPVDLRRLRGAGCT
jgi:anti-sigma regulatory factor (Ser/Thr protein kinase)